MKRKYENGRYLWCLENRRCVDCLGPATHGVRCHACRLLTNDRVADWRRRHPNTLAVMLKERRTA